MARAGWLVVIIFAAAPFTATGGSLADAAGWAVLDLAFDGQATFVATARGPSSFGMGVLLVGPDGRAHFTASGTYTVQSFDVWAVEETTGARLHWHSENSSGGPALQMGVQYSGPPGPMRVVFFAAGSVDEFSYFVTGSASSLAARGDRTFYSDGESFEGGREVAFQIAGVYASAADDRAFDLDLGGKFVGQIGRRGHFLPPDVSHGNITLVGPELFRVCPCTVVDLAGAQSVGPGLHHARRNIIETYPDERDMVLYGADVVLPPPE